MLAAVAITARVPGFFSQRQGTRGLSVQRDHRPTSVAHERRSLLHCLGAIWEGYLKLDPTPFGCADCSLKPRRRSESIDQIRDVSPERPKGDAELFGRGLISHA